MRYPSSQVKEGKAAIYVRVSTLKEAQKDSPDHQKNVCLEVARYHGLQVYEEFIYEDRDTGTNIVDRPAIQQLVRDAKRGAFNVIMFSSLSRFARDTADALDLKRKLVNALGLRLVSLEENYDSDIDQDELKFTIVSAVNQKMSEQISHSSRRGIRQSALKGNFTGSIPPYGYKKQTIAGKKTLVPDEKTKDIARLIFTLYVLNKMGEKEIVNYLNERGIPSPKGGIWGITTIQRILQNEAYVGRNVFCKYEQKKVYTNIADMSQRKNKLVQRDKKEWEYAHNPHTHEAIIEEEMFTKAQEIRLQRGGGKRGGIRNRVNVFAGMIKCAHCGSSLVSMKSKTRSQKEYRYLICSKRRRQGPKGCENDSWIPYERFRDDLLGMISSRMRSITSPEELLERHKSSIRIDTVNTEKRLKEIEERIIVNRKLLSDLRREKLLGEIAEEQYKFEKEQCEKKIDKLEWEKAQIEQEISKKDDLYLLYEEVQDALDEMLDLDFEKFDELHLVVKKLIESITVNKEKEIHVKTMFGIELQELEEVNKQEYQEV
jgi:DNA invertase Pin-like site-specific DNA recombinase